MAPWHLRDRQPRPSLPTSTSKNQPRICGQLSSFKAFILPAFRAGSSVRPVFQCPIHRPSLSNTATLRLEVTSPGAPPHSSLQELLPLSSPYPCIARVVLSLFLSLSLLFSLSLFLSLSLSLSLQCFSFSLALALPGSRLELGLWALKTRIPDRPGSRTSRRAPHFEV